MLNESDFQITNAYDSHRPVLWKALQYVAGQVACPIIEFGCGEGSTNLLSQFAKENGNDFLSFDNNREWAEKMGSEYNPYWGNVGLGANDGRWLSFGKPNAQIPIGLLFIDHAPAERRKVDIERFADKAKIIVVHDTEEGAEYVYGLKETLAKFKYRYDFKPEGYPHTTMLSNFVNFEGVEIK